MAMADPHSDSANDPREISSAAVMVRCIAASLIAMFVLGIALGFSGAVAERGEAPGPTGIAIFAVATIGGIAALVWLLLPLRYRRQRAAPSVRRSQRIFLISATLGAVTGLLAYFFSNPRHATTGTEDFLLNPSPAVALLLIGALAVGMVLTVMWMVTIDEHERKAYDFGSNLAIHTYLMLGASWWIAARAELVPAVDGPLLFALVVCTWLAGWLWRRYR